MNEELYHAISFLGVGTPDEVRAQRQQQLEATKKRKNKKAQKIDCEVMRQARFAGISKRAIREVQNAHKRQPPVKVHNNYRWTPRAEGES